MFTKWIISTIAALSSNKKTGELAAGVAFGLLLAFIPANNLLWPIILILTMLIKVHQGMEFIWLAIFKLLVPLIDWPLHNLGYAVLNISFLEKFFTWVNNIPLLPFTRFNNTLVMGGIVAGILFWAPAFFLFKFLITKYREKFQEKIEKSKFLSQIKKLPLIKGLVSLITRAAAVADKIS